MSDLETAWQAIQASIAKYFALFERPTNQTSLRELAMALDDLVLTYFQSPDIEPSDQPIEYGTRIDEAEFAERAHSHFPELDFYWIAEPDGQPDQEVVGSTATGDLAEIAGDFAQIQEIAATNGLADAIWEFRFGYQIHWGRHLHELRTYLHTLAAW